MATPRCLLVDPQNECDYHIASRCVRRAFLCGIDDLTGHDYSHRRDWLVERLKQLTRCFAIGVYSYTVLSNHFHLVLRYDPVACRLWSDEEVAWRWFEAFPPREHGQVVEERKPELRELMLGDPNRVACARRTLGSMSDFMKHLKQPIARRANLEDDCQGHFFEQRFYSGALLTEEAMIAAMAYVDLNPVRAELADRIEAIQHTSIAERLLENSAQALEDYLRPVASGLEDFMADSGATREPQESREEPRYSEASGHTYAVSPAVTCAQDTDDRQGVADRQPGRESEVATGESRGCTATAESDAKGVSGLRRRRLPRPAVTLVDYIDLLRAMIDAERAPAVKPTDRVAQWLARTKVLKRPQRAYGTEASLRQWLTDRGLRFREVSLPV